MHAHPIVPHAKSPPQIALPALLQGLIMRPNVLQFVLMPHTKMELSVSLVQLPAIYAAHFLFALVAFQDFITSKILALVPIFVQQGRTLTILFFIVQHVSRHVLHVL